MRSQLLHLAGEARQAATAAHRAYRDGALALGRDGQPVLAALGRAATSFEHLAGELERLAEEANPST